jgi:small subunit ribosomal protein S2
MSQNLPSMTDMLKAGVHFGHSTSRWHPKMKQFIHGSRSHVHIIDLEKTRKQLEEALLYIQGVVSRGGKVMFVGTKDQQKAIVQKYAESCEMPYVTERWLGGTLTNFHQIKKSIKRLRKLKDQRDKGELRKYTKKEQLLLGREIEDMQLKLGGIELLERVPDTLVALDVRVDKTAIEEAKVIGMNVVALCDTNVNPKLIDYIIPGNDDSVRSIDLICSLMADAVKIGKAERTKQVHQQKTKKENSTKEEKK